MLAETCTWRSARRILPVGAGGRDEEVLARERELSGFAGKQRRVHAAFAELQSRYERKFFSSLDKEQRKVYRTMAGSLLLFDLK